jgi:ATP-dependent DNA helicase RecG
MCRITGTHPADITKMLQHLVALEALSKEGQGRWTSYRLPLDSVHKEPNSVHKEPNSVHKEPNSIHSLEQNDTAIDETLLEIAAQARNNKRLPPEKMEQTILKLCTNRWLTRNQLGKLVQRNADGLRSRFLSPMAERGVLQLRYPDKPNHIDQAYTANLDNGQS